MELLYTVEEVAEMFKIEIHTVHKLLRSAELGGVRVGRQWRIRQSDIDEFFINNTNRPGIRIGG